MNTRALVVDDHPGFRATARRLLAAAGIDVVAEAPDAATALQLARRHRPDLVLLDVRLPDGDGFDVARALHRSGIRTTTLLTSSTVGDDYAELAIAAGAAGFLPKSDLDVAVFGALLDRGADR